MTFGAIFASLLAAVAASDGQAEAVPVQAELDAPRAAEIATSSPSAAVPIAASAAQAATAAPDAATAANEAATAPEAATAATQAATAAPEAAATAAAGEPAAPAASEPSALAEAARVVLSAGAAGTPIVIAPAVDPVAEEAQPAPGDPADADASPEPADAARGDAATGSPPLSAAPAGPPLSDAAPILLERVEAEDGWATERIIEPSGEIVLHTVNAAGTVQVCRTVGSLLSLALVEQRPAAGGEFVHVARDTTGALVSYAIGTDGEPRAVSLVAPAPR